VLSEPVIAQLQHFVNQKALHIHATGKPCVPGAVVAAELWLKSSEDVKHQIIQSETYSRTAPPFQSSGKTLSTLINSPFTTVTLPELSDERNDILADLAQAMPQRPLAELTQLLQQNHWALKPLKKAAQSQQASQSPMLIAKSPQAPSAEWTSSLSQLTAREHDCPCCLDTYPVDQMVSLRCRHLYCADCMAQFLELKIQEGGGNTTFICPGFECNQQFDEVVVASLVSAPVFHQYNAFLANTYVAQSTLIKWCPAGKCDCATKITPASRSQVLCECGHTWCWSCRQEAHWPATCDQQKWWTDVYTRDEAKLVYQSLDEAETVKWLLNYTQDCPKCTSPIEKSGGCNHMSCKKCSYQYCWVCKDPWTGSHYNCKTKAEGGHDRADEIAKRIDTNLSFRQMYIIHLRAKKETDTKAQEAALKFCQQLVAHPTTTVEDVDAIFQALDVILLSRHILLKICILGKYLQENKMSGSLPLKKEIRRIGTQASFTVSCLEFPNVKAFNRDDVSAALIGMRSCFQHFNVTFQGVVKANQK